jgi:hypothetical protein
VLGLAAGALAWCGLVVVTSQALGYAALSRFLLPATAIVCVLAGVGVVRLVAAVPRGRTRIAVVVVVAAVSVPFVAWRAAGIPDQVDEVAVRGRYVDDLVGAFALAGGRDAALGCGRISVGDAGVPRMAAAWELDVPLGAVRARPGRGAGTAVQPRPSTAGLGRRAARLEARTGRSVELVGTTGSWAVFRVGCPG